MKFCDISLSVLVLISLAQPREAAAADGPVLFADAGRNETHFSNITELGGTVSGIDVIHEVETGFVKTVNYSLSTGKKLISLDTIFITSSGFQHLRVREN